MKLFRRNMVFIDLKMKGTSRNIIRVFIFVCIVLCSVSGFAQNRKAGRLYYRGMKAYNSNNLKKADSLFTLSAELSPNIDVFFNLATVKNELGDQCGSCDYLNKAWDYGDTAAHGMIKKYCFERDSIFYSNGFYCVFEKRLCTDDYNFSFFKKSNAEKDSIVLLKNKKSLNNEDYLSSSFEVEKYIDTVVISLNVVQPVFPGGQDALLKYLASNIIYPFEARDKNIQGTVVVNYIVEADGTISHVELVRGIGGGCDEEALRIVSSMPAWSPGTQLDRPVRFQFRLPIRFILH